MHYIPFFLNDIHKIINGHFVTYHIDTPERNVNNYVTVWFYPVLFTSQQIRNITNTNNLWFQYQVFRNNY